MTQSPSASPHDLPVRPCPGSEGVDNDESSSRRSQLKGSSLDGATQGHDAFLLHSRLLSSSNAAQSVLSGISPQYQDRDDPRYGREDHEERYHRGHDRRRSRSPNANRERHLPSRSTRQTEPSQSVPWKDLRAPVSDQRATAVSKGPPGIALASTTTAPNKRFASDISRWNRKQSELHHSEAGPGDLDLPTHFSGSSVQRLQSTQPSRISQAAEVADTGPALSDVTEMSEAELTSYDYKDVERIACLLCQRKFKSIDTLHRHVTESQLHKDNLANIETCQQGVVRQLESKTRTFPRSDASQVSTVASPSLHPSIASQGQTALPYRDRASERRAVFGADTPSKQSDSSNRTKVFQGPNATPSTVNMVEAIPQSSPEKPIDSDNVGSKLLTMMGWTQGQGLGAKREGRTEIVETKIYKAGAGLGSSAPTDTATHLENKQAVSSHKSGSGVAFTGYLDRAKDRVRQRLAEHSQHPTH